MYNIIIGRW